MYMNSVLRGLHTVLEYSVQEILFHFLFSVVPRERQKVSVLRQLHVW
jgi:hypothetical protein